MTLRHMVYLGGEGHHEDGTYGVNPNPIFALGEGRKSGRLFGLVNLAVWT